LPEPALCRQVSSTGITEPRPSKALQPWLATVLLFQFWISAGSLSTCTATAEGTTHPIFSCDISISTQALREGWSAH